MAEPEDHLWSADHSLGNAGLDRQTANNTTAVQAFACRWEQSTSASRHLSAKSVHVSIHSHIATTEADQRSTKFAFLVAAKTM
jgi:hypothetical protein